MAEPSKTLTLDNRPISSYLATSFDALKANVQPGKRGYASGGVTLKGVEAGIAWQPKTDLWLTGYAGRLWGGGWEAGARVTYSF